MWRQIAIFVGVIELILFLCVFLQPESLDNQKMVSDQLCLTCSTFRVALCHPGRPADNHLWALHLAVLEPLSLIILVVPVRAGSIALLGWILVVVCDPKKQSLGHAFGAGIFVGGTCAYYVCMIILALRNRFQQDSSSFRRCYHHHDGALVSSNLDVYPAVVHRSIRGLAGWRPSVLSFCIGLHHVFLCTPFQPEFARLQLVETPMQCSPLMGDSPL